MRPVGKEIQYKYYYPTKGEEINDILNDNYFAEATLWDVKRNSDLPITVPTSYAKYPLDYLSKVKSDTENKIAQEEWAAQEAAKKAEKEELSKAVQNNPESPNYLWTTHSPSGQTGVTGGTN